MDCVCVPFRGWMGKTKDPLIGYGSRCQVHRFVSRTAMLLGFSHSTFSCLYQEWSTTQSKSRQLDTTVGSIGVNMGQHPCGMPSTPCRVHAPGVQLNITKGVPNVWYTSYMLLFCVHMHHWLNLILIRGDNWSLYSVSCDLYGAVAVYKCLHNSLKTIWKLEMNQRTHLWK